MIRAVIHCPICKKPVEEPKPGQPAGKFPFCSERCKLIDLGRWLDGKYQIPVEISPDENEERDSKIKD
jgi:endogenous inhibitor of DNA gyrase (YacG/DUF329 family)